MQKRLVLAYVKPEFAEPDSARDIENLGVRSRVMILAEPAYDPRNKRLRSHDGKQEMDPQPIILQQNHQIVLDRFTTSCASDERVVAAFIGGSFAKGQVDAYSDLDLYLITTDGKYDEFLYWD